MSDPELVRRQFEDFVAARQGALLRTAYLMTGNHHDADELVQSALIKAFPHWSRIAHAPEPYVRTVLTRETVSRWRRRRWREVSTSTPPDFTQIAAPDTEVTERHRMRDALMQLPPRQRAVLVLRYFDDQTEAQTAHSLGVSVGTIKSQARDGLARLRTILSADLTATEQTAPAAARRP